jgi:carboxypeptidase family protein
MRNMKAFFLLFGLTLFLASGAQQAKAQTSTTGDLTGVVTDPAGAVVPNVKVQLRNVAQGGTHDTKTNDAGVYRFSLLPAGQYEVSVQASGFQALSTTTSVNIGQVTTLDLKLTLGATTERVVVIEEAPLVQTESGDLATTLDERTIQNMPNQGNDMSYPLEMTAGVTENTLGGYGNYSVNGMSATANLFTLNGMDDNDPYLSLNNTGATSLMLGQNEVEEATIEANSYGGQYGTLAGSNVNFVTKSGTNQFHGEAKYYWTGRAFAANSFFHNATDTPKSFSNANQYGGDFGGRIIKDKLFFFFDTEGIRLVTPSSAPTVLIPDAAFETSTINNLNSLGLSASVPFYTNMFNLWNAAGTAGHAVPGAANGGSGCGNIITTASGTTVPFAPAGVTNCVDHFQTTSVLRTNEALYAGRMDYVIGTNDHIYGRVQSDIGFQGSYTDPISPLFNLVSPQPEYQGQLMENHTFGPTATNQFLLSGQWYSATFNQPSRPAAIAAFPTSLIFGDGTLTTLGGIDEISPQGRNVTQAQVSDDVTKTVSRHTLKFGVKYRRNDVTDLVYGQNTSGTMVAGDLDAFYNGGFDPAFTDPKAGVLNTTSYSQLFPANGEQRFKFWNVGGYAEDDIQVKSNLTISLALRGDHFSDPTCKNLCFARLVEPFNQLVNDPVLGGANAVNVPYSQIITLNQKQALNGFTNIQWAPRFGFAWQPFGRDHNTVVRGGIGIFYNSFPGQVVDNISENPPLAPTFTVGSGALPLAISPAEPKNLIGTAAASNAGFQTGFISGLTEAQIAATVPGFANPSMNFTDFENAPQYQKWSLEIEHGFGRNDSVTISYSGNHGIHEPVQNSALNAYSPSPFAGLPTSAPDPRFGYVEGVFSEAVSNYNGVSISATHRYSSGQISANYTYSHALDEISNGGFSPLAYTSFFSTNTSPIFPQDPNNLRGMYGNADYDVRHYFSLQYLWELPIKRLTFGHGPDSVLKGWNVSGTLLARTGLPFTVVDEGTTTTLEGTNYGQVFGGGATPAPLVFASVGTGNPGTCSGPGSNVNNPCFNTAAFTTSPTGFGNVGRNTMRGPGYWNTDFAIWKSMKVIPHHESAEFDLGFQIYNLFNHPNFDNPVYNVAAANFGTLQRTISPATTVYGVALGADASMRIAQLKAEFKF